MPKLKQQQKEGQSTPKWTEKEKQMMEKAEKLRAEAQSTTTTDNNDSAKPTKVSTSTTEIEAGAVIDELEEILDTEDGQKYLSMTELSGEATKDQLYADDVLRAEWITNFNAWLESDKPKIAMPKVSADVKIPAFIIKCHDRGRDYMYIIYQDGTIEGKKINKKYASEKNEITGKVYGSDIVTSTSTVYDIPFNDVQARIWIKSAKQLVPPHLNWRMYIQSGTMVHTVSEKNFFKSHRELMDIIADNKSIN